MDLNEATEHAEHLQDCPDDSYDIKLADWLKENYNV